MSHSLGVNPSPRGLDALHPVSDPSVVWYGGVGHRTLSMDGGGIECYRCGMAAEPDAWRPLGGRCKRDAAY